VGSSVTVGGPSIRVASGHLSTHHLLFLGKKMKRVTRKPVRLRFAPLAMSIAIGITGLAPLAAFAQDDDVAEDAATLDAISVTGTRINSPNAVSNSPIASYSAEELETKQTVTVEDFIKLLPGAMPSIGPGTNNGSGGAATIDLRGLGANRTLVLINGRRVVPFNLTGVVDTNTIPVALIDRIDIVTGGASAVYGADAIAGVVNFILKENFEGTEFAAQYGTSDESDADRQRIDVTFGANSADDRGNVVLSVGHTKTDPLQNGDRDFGLFTINSVDGTRAGSGTTTPAAFTNFPGVPGRSQIQPNGSIGTPVTLFNTNPLNYYQTPLDRLQATAMGHFEFTDGHELYGELLYSRSDVDTQLAESGTFANNFNVPVGNPFLPEPARQQMCAALNIPAAQCTVGNTTTARFTVDRRIVEFGPRLNDFENKTFQGTVGVRGAITDTWSYDAYYSFGEADQIQTRGNWGSLSRVQQALLAVNPNTCITPTNGCVPLNVFGQSGSITQAMLAFIDLDAILRQNVEQDVGAVSVNGDLGDRFKSPWTDYPIAVAGGYEMREVYAETKSDQASQIQGEVLGTGAPTPDRRGSFELNEGFVELFVPVVNDRPWAHSISLELGYRYTEFESQASDSYDTYKFGGEWAPVEGFRVRGLVQRASRAPNVNELFAPQVTGLSNLAVDPCQGAAINAGQANTPGTLSNLCRLTGVPLANIGNIPAPSSGQVNVLTGGNPLLGPEIADTTTLGFVWEPRFADSLVVSLDYYDIEVDDFISNPAVADILQQCYTTAFNPNLEFNAACQLVGRDPFNGTFSGAGSRGIGLVTSNQGKLATDGLDLAVNYRWDMGDWGGLSFAWNLTHVLNWEFQATPTSVNRDCLGFYSVACSNAAGIVHQNKSNFRTTWTLNDFDVSASWRYLDSVIEEPGGQAFLPAFSSIGSYSYFDLAAQWRVMDHVRLNLTIDNVMDKQPPFVGNTIGGTTFNNGNTFPQFYDVVGRFYTLGVTVSFGPEPDRAVIVDDEVMPPPPAPAPAPTCADKDDDGDGVNNCDDKCPNSTAGQSIGPDGCALPEPAPQEDMPPQDYKG
jgi:outer membrane receptor protein involved in Fe transport